MSRRKETGLSLIELMVTIVVGLLLLAGVSRIFLNSKQGYRVQESVARLQENGRYAVETLSRSVRMADFWAGVLSTAVTRVDGTTTAITYANGSATTCKDGWLINSTEALRGYDGAASGLPTDFDCAASGDYVANSDVLVLRYADPDQWVTSADLCDAAKTKQDNGRVFLKALTDRRGVLFDISTADCANASSGAAASIAGEAKAGVLNYRYKFQAFWLRKCSTLVSGSCTSAADDGNPLPSLVVTDLAKSGTNTLVVAEGVEMLKFEYGVDTTGDRIVDRYDKAGNITSTNWNNVLTVRVSMILRGDALDSFTDGTSYDMTSTYSFTPSGTAQRYQRRLLVKELQIRNRFRQS